jgi:hypothetical protein
MLYTQQNDISEREFNSILTRTKFELHLFDQLQPIVAEYTYHQLADLDFREISDKLISELNLIMSDLEIVDISFSVFKKH